MTNVLKSIPRHQIDTNAWDACVAASQQRIVYGYSWYLDAVLPAPDWKWVGLVALDGTGQYRAVMPIPLRRKQLFGVSYTWVVHQPLFCQLLAVFSPDERVEPTPFLQWIEQQFRYGSILCVRQPLSNAQLLNQLRPLTTHVLDLSADYQTIYQHYSRDRKLNLRRACREFGQTTDGQAVVSSDPEPLLALFRDNHAGKISGGVADWAYPIFRNLFEALHKRGMGQIRYAVRSGQVEAGALFVREGKRIIYLFNAASDVGRRSNARTLLIDQVIQENAGKTLIFDFESPEKPAIRDFYRSFGSQEETYWTMRWNRLNALEQMVLTLKNQLTRQTI